MHEIMVHIVISIQKRIDVHTSQDFDIRGNMENHSKLPESYLPGGSVDFWVEMNSIQSTGRRKIDKDRPHTLYGREIALFAGRGTNVEHPEHQSSDSPINFRIKLTHLL